MFFILPIPLQSSQLFNLSKLNAFNLIFNVFLTPVKASRRVILYGFKISLHFCGGCGPPPLLPKKCANISS